MTSFWRMRKGCSREGAAIMSELEHLVSKAQAAAAQGGLGQLSTGEALAVALLLNRPDWLAEMDYTIAEALKRIGPDWVALIPAAASALEHTNCVLREAAQASREDAVVTSYASAEVVDVAADLVTYGDAPGYRDVQLTFDIQRHGANAKHRINLRLSAEDGAAVAQHIQDAHRRAWAGAGPIDVQRGEIRPRWID